MKSLRRRVYDYIKNEGNSFGVRLDQITSAFPEERVEEELDYLLQEFFIIERSPCVFLAINTEVNTLSGVEDKL